MADREKLDDKNAEEETSPVVVALVTIAVVVASVALILSIVTLSNKNGAVPNIEIMSDGSSGAQTGIMNGLSSGTIN